MKICLQHANPKTVCVFWVGGRWHDSGRDSGCLPIITLPSRNPTPAIDQIWPYRDIEHENVSTRYGLTGETQPAPSLVRGQLQNALRWKNTNQTLEHRCTKVSVTKNLPEKYILKSIWKGKCIVFHILIAPLNFGNGQKNEIWWLLIICRKIQNMW